jgi:Uma2 family endonuclease
MPLPAASLGTARDDRATDDQIIILHGLTWADWRRLLDLRGDRPVPRMAYVDGSVELMSPSRDHERIKSILGSLIEVWAEHCGLDVVRLGSWTLEHAPGAAVEPDECFEVLGEGDDAGRARPDLAVEVIWTSGRLSKLEAYRALGVPEVWVWRRDTLRVFVLGPDGYVEADASAVLPGLDLRRVLTLLGEPTTTAAVRALRAMLASAG